MPQNWHLKYGLNALQPWDLIYGQDLMQSSMRHEAMRVQKRFRPFLLMMRLDEWYHLQLQDRPLLDLTADLAEVQHKHGRFFWIESPQNSEVWEQDRLQRLLSLPGVWSVVVDAGAFGAQIDGNPIAKTIFVLLETCLAWMRCWIVD